jgi:hypothetical protein
MSNEETVETPVAPAPEPAPELVDDNEQVELTPDVFKKAISQDTADPDQDREQPAAVDAAYDLADSIPEYVPKHLAEDPATIQALQDVGGFAKEAGIPPKTARMLTTLYANLALAEQDQAPGREDEEAVRRYLVHQYGSQADAIIKGAQEGARKLGPKFTQFLNDTGLGNDVSMLMILGGFAKDGLFADRNINTPAAARAELKKMRADKDHLINKPGTRGRGAALVRWKMLSAVANMDDGSAKDGGQSERASEKRGEQALKDRRKPPGDDAPTVKAEREAKELMRSEAWHDKRNPAHKATAARIAELFRLAYPEK